MDVGRACCVMLCFVRIHKTSPHTNSDVQPAFVSFSRTDPRRCVTLCECVLFNRFVRLWHQTLRADKEQTFPAMYSKSRWRKTSGCPGRVQATFRKPLSPGFSPAWGALLHDIAHPVSLQLFHCQFVSSCTERKRTIYIKDFIEKVLISSKLQQT